MTGMIDWLFSFLARAFAIPELHAVVAGMAAGLAVAYVLTVALPASTPFKVAVQYARVVVFLTVMVVALSLKLSTYTAAWAFTVALLAPLFHEWLFAIVYHRWPWLRPKALRPEHCPRPEE